MLVRVQLSTPSWATRKCLCLLLLGTPSIFRYFCSLDLCICFSASFSVWVFSEVLCRSYAALLSLLCCMPSINLLLVLQTLYVEPGLCLCDCPGLVMPSFVSTKAEMTCSGILPIDQMRDHVPPVSLISFLLCAGSGCYVYMRASRLDIALHLMQGIKSDILRMGNLKYFLVICPRLYNEMTLGLQN